MHVLYATNLPGEILDDPLFDIDELYGKRWDIESHYHKVKEVRLRTASCNHGARTFFFFMSPVFLNMWYMYNRREKSACEGRPQTAPALADQAPAGAGCEGGEAEAGPAAAGDEEEEEEEDEKKEEDDQGSKPADPSGGGGGGAPDRDEIVRLATGVQNRPKRKYYKISLVYLIGLVTTFREYTLSWRYRRNRITRRIEEFVESAASAH